MKRSVAGYRLGAVLGRGGMGVVHEARRGRQTFAMKLILADDIDDDERRRFRREIKALLSLDHPHVVRCLDAGEVDGRPFLVMPRLVGRSLSLELAGGPLAPALAARLVRDAARGVAAAHAVGIVHRDLKPSNLYLHREGERAVIKVLDFGVAMRARHTGTSSESLTESNSRLGTVRYSAPEQTASARDVDERADVWSLGLTLREALTGEDAWAGKNDFQVIAALVRGEAPPPLPEGAAPEALRSCVEEALAVDPGARLPSARALADRLAAWCGEDDVDWSELPLRPAVERALAETRPRAAQTALASPRSRWTLGAGTLAVLAASLGWSLSRPSPGAPVAAPEPPAPAAAPPPATRPTTSSEPSPTPSTPPSAPAPSASRPLAPPRAQQARSAPSARPSAAPTPPTAATVNVFE